MSRALRIVIACMALAPLPGVAQVTATSPALRDVTADPDTAPAVVPETDTDVTGGFAPAPAPVPEAAAPGGYAPAPEPDPPQPEPDAATVPGIEDMLPDAGKASDDGVGTIRAGSATRRAQPEPAPLPQAGASAIALPAGAGSLDSTTVQRIVDRLVGQHFLTSAADAQDPLLFAEAVKAFQASVGISPTGTLDRDTIGRLVTQ